MPKPSKVTRLTPQLRAELERLLIERSMTFEQLAEHLRSLGGDISKSGINRYAIGREKANERIRLAREMTAALGKDLKDLPEEDHDRAASELIMATLVQAATNMAQLDAPETKETLEAAMALDKLAGARKKNTETFALRAKIREEERQRAAKIAAKTLDTMVAERGFSQETVDAFKERMLGVTKRSA